MLSICDALCKIGPINHKENLINTIIDSINNSNKRKDFGNRAFKRFQEELNSNIVTNQLIDFIKSN